MKGIIVLGLMILFITACGQESPDKGGAAAGQAQSASVARNNDFAQVARGGKIFQDHCSECHGKQGQGAPDWRVRGPDGFLPAPPLNGTGHAWHHPDRVLRMVIKFGSPGGQGKMPAWKEKLTDQQILDVIAWFKSRWPDDVYAEWYKMNERSKAKGVAG